MFVVVGIIAGRVKDRDADGSIGVYYHTSETGLSLDNLQAGIKNAMRRGWETLTPSTYRSGATRLLR
jgi:hypothetical protein